MTEPGGLDRLHSKVGSFSVALVGNPNSGKTTLLDRKSVV